MAGELTSKVRFVRCPGCRGILQEVAPLYQCAGCGTVLQGNKISFSWLLAISWIQIWFGLAVSNFIPLRERRVSFVWYSVTVLLGKKTYFSFPLFFLEIFFPFLRNLLCCFCAIEIKDVVLLLPKTSQIVLSSCLDWFISFCIFPTAKNRKNDSTVTGLHMHEKDAAQKNELEHVSDEHIAQS